jgi:hypothetical protein
MIGKGNKILYKKRKKDEKELFMNLVKKIERKSSRKKNKYE